MRKPGNSKPERNAAVYKRHLEGATHMELSREFGISYQHVKDIIATEEIRIRKREHPELT